MDWQNLLQYLKKGENKHINFISTLTSEDDLGAALVAFSNTEGGGHIFIGIDIINYHLRGTEIDDKFINTLIEKFCNPVFKPTATIIKRNDQKILVITVAEGNNKPYLFKKRCYVRDEKNTRLAIKEEERALLEKKSFNKILKSHKIDNTGIVLKLKKPVKQLEVKIEKTSLNANKKKLSKRIRRKK
ncbi:MAG: ATP-binding protein [Candidatus Margulisiibacteriota bacterium]|jgi:predicted HTH transcriptional regulator